MTGTKTCLYFYWLSEYLIYPFPMHCYVYKTWEKKGEFVLVLDFLGGTRDYPTFQEFLRKAVTRERWCWPFLHKSFTWKDPPLYAVFFKEGIGEDPHVLLKLWRCYWHFLQRSKSNSLCWKYHECGSVSSTFRITSVEREINLSSRFLKESQLSSLEQPFLSLTDLTGLLQG